jgi:PAS domain S-box-containing protein
MLDRQSQHPLRIRDEDAALRAILEGTATATGEAFFAALVENLAKALNTHSAWVAEFIEETRMLRVLAFWAEGDLLEEFEIPVDGTPCLEVIERVGLIHYPENILEFFPDRPGLREIGAVSYMGLPLLDVDGGIIGNLAILDNRPMPEEPRALTLFKIFADRASAELRRVQAERGIREREEKYRRIVETTGEGFLLLEHDMTIMDINQACARMLNCERDAIIGKAFIDFVAEDARAFLIANQDDLFAGAYNEFESVLMSGEDRRVSVLVHSDTLRNDKGSIVGTMLFVTDITEQKKSLALAGEFQKSLLPRESPEIAGFDIAGKTVACDDIGGDYYDYLPVTACVDDHFGVVVGDVTDHGATAALLMATARAFLRMRASQCGAISQIITEMNRQLTQDVLDTGRFMTLFYLTINTGNRDLRWVRAGHDPAVLYDPATDRFEELKGQGLALGVDDQYVYREYAKSGIGPGQILAIGTDGIWEAHNRQGVIFGKERFGDILRRHADLSAADIIAAVYRELAEYTAGLLPADDITLVIIKVTAE